MKKINIRKFYYHLTHDYLTMNNLVIVVAFVIAAGWAWGSVEVMQRNYTLQSELDSKKRQLLLAELETQTLEFQQHYFQSEEYKEIEARDKFGLAHPGEKVVILPPNSKAAQEASQEDQIRLVAAMEPSNFQQWMNFLFGGNSQTLQTEA